MTKWEKNAQKDKAWKTGVVDGRGCGIKATTHTWLAKPDDLELI